MSHASGPGMSHLSRPDLSHPFAAGVDWELKNKQTNEQTKNKQTLNEHADRKDIINCALKNVMPSASSRTISQFTYFCMKLAKNEFDFLSG